MAITNKFRRLSLNQTLRILSYVETRNKKVRLNKQDASEVSHLITRLRKLNREVQTYMTIRGISFFVLYIGIITSIFQRNMFIGILDTFAGILLGTLGTAFFVFVIFATGALISVRVTDAEMHAASALAIIDGKGKRLKHI